MTTTFAKPASGAPSVRTNIDAIARALNVPLAPGADVGLSLTIGDMPVSIDPTAHGRLAAFFKLDDVARVPVKLMTNMLAEAAAWGLDGEALRFAVVEDDFVLLWTPAPMAPALLLAQWREVVATALAAREIAAQLLS